MYVCEGHVMSMQFLFHDLKEIDQETDVFNRFVSFYTFNTVKSLIAQS